MNQQQLGSITVLWLEDFYRVCQHSNWQVCFLNDVNDVNMQECFFFKLQIQIFAYSREVLTFPGYVSQVHTKTRFSLFQYPTLILFMSSIRFPRNSNSVIEFVFLVRDSCAQAKTMHRFTECDEEEKNHRVHAHFHHRAEDNVQSSFIHFSPGWEKL